MKTTIWILVSLFFLVYSSKPTITFKPFSVDFGSPYTPFGIFFLVIALSCFNLQSRKHAQDEYLEKYYRKGWRAGSDFTIEQINEKIKEQGKDCTISVQHND